MRAQWRVGRIILAIVVPLVTAIALEAAHPHQAAERAFVFVAALAVAVALAVMVGSDNYVPSASEATEGAPKPDRAGHARKLTPTAWVGIVLLIILLIALIGLSICGAMFSV